MLRKIYRIIIHHSATKDSPAKPDWEAIRKYHIEHNGWDDIGYHFGIEYVDGVARLRLGRPVKQIGAHCKGANKDSIGICVVGNYNKQSPASNQMYRLFCLCKTLCRAFGIGSIVGHDEVRKQQGLKPKGCPGEYFGMERFRDYWMRLKL